MSGYRLSHDNFQRLIDRLDNAIAEIERAERRVRLWQFATYALLTYVVIGWLR